jgi:GGDEF domain-containing protein
MSNRVEIMDCVSGPRDNDLQAIENDEMCLPTLMRLAVLNVPEVDSVIYGAFRSNVYKLAPLLPELPIKADDMVVIRDIFHEFGHYHKCANTEIRGRLSGWSALVAKLLTALLSRMSIDPAAKKVAPLVQRIGTLLTSEEIHSYLILLEDFFRLNGINRPVDPILHKKAINRSTNNDNVVGLRGGGGAVAQVKRIIAQRKSGFAVNFELCCLDAIKERFGEEAVQDCMMVISAFLTRSLRDGDTVYYWSDTALMAILQSTTSKEIIIPVIQRIIDNNRDITIRMGGRIAMLRIPLKFNITPISELQNATDLYNLY